jgi:3',5'-cyclic AMP phosphodiesterase CpdA
VQYSGGRGNRGGRTVTACTGGDSLREGHAPTGRGRKAKGIGPWLLAALLLWTSGVAAQPAAPESRGATRVVVLSDFNESYGSVQYSTHVDAAVERTKALKPDLVISTGDMVAGQRIAPPLSRAQMEAMWDAFHAHVSDPLAKAGLPFAVTPGNHDASSGERFRVEREVYREKWLPRKPALEFLDATHYPFYYAFRVGDVLFVSLDATHVGHLSRAEKRWLQTLLDKEGSRFRQRVVFSHVPLWPFAVDREADFLGDHELEAILRRGNVDLYLSGHHHAYYPGAKDGVRYVSQACLGAAPRPLIGTRELHGRGITVIDFDATGALRVEAYGGPDFTRRIARSALPDRIESKWATMVRDDLAATETERARAVSAR